MATPEPNPIKPQNVEDNRNAQESSGATPGSTPDLERIGPKKADTNGHAQKSGGRAAESPSGGQGISQRKLDANRANAQKSTGPTSEEGKESSKMNALIHGMLAREVVISRGDYREDAVAFQGLLDWLVELYRPVGAAEQLEVENIAKCYWCKIREARYTNAITRQRTLGMRQREEQRRAENVVDRTKYGTPETLEGTAGGLQHIIEVMKNVKKGIQAPELSEEVKAQLAWLVDRYLHDLSEYPDLRAEKQQADGTWAADLSPEAVGQLTAAIDRRLSQLTRRQILAADLEKEQLDAKIDAAALPLRRLDLVARYVTSNDRELERSMKRLEVLQQVRKASGRIWPAKGA